MFYTPFLLTRREQKLVNLMKKSMRIRKKIYALSESRVNIESESDCSDNDLDF